MEQTLIKIGLWIMSRSEGDWVFIGACLVLGYGLDVLVINPMLERLHRNTWI